MRNLVLTGVLVISFVIPAAAQSDEDVSLPDSVMEQVVSRIIKFYFKPGRPRVVYLSNSNINESWVPKIANINFKFVDELSTEAQHLNGFVFESVTKNSSNTYFINFGYGALGCGDRTGDQWSFEIGAMNTVNSLQLSGSGWGSACTPPPLAAQGPLLAHGSTADCFFL